MRHARLAIPAALVVLLAGTGCGRLEGLLTETTPETWLASHPWTRVSIGPTSFVLAEPSSTFFVYGLGLALVVAGLAFLRRGASTSPATGPGAGASAKRVWGLALLVWAAATFSAGTSYQAFSYEIKFAGRAVGLWTSWWEIVYLGLFVASMDLIAVAVARSSARGAARKAITGFAALDLAAYLSVLLSGALVPDRFLASFECMLLFAVPVFMVLFVINLVGWIATRSVLELRLLLSWVGLLAVILAYFGYYLSGGAEALWARGVWFNANDVLHLGLVAWVAWLAIGVRPLVVDAA